jgi:hypothetical protein
VLIEHKNDFTFSVYRLYVNAVTTKKINFNVVTIKITQYKDSIKKVKQFLYRPGQALRFRGG